MTTDKIIRSNEDSDGVIYIPRSWVESSEQIQITLQKSITSSSNTIQRNKRSKRTKPQNIHIKDTNCRFCRGELVPDKPKISVWDYFAYKLFGGN